VPLVQPPAPTQHVSESDVRAAMHSSAPSVSMDPVEDPSDVGFDAHEIANNGGWVATPPSHKVLPITISAASSLQCTPYMETLH
jgi:hypothetical protein